jgi:hypothetical protein
MASTTTTAQPPASDVPPDRGDPPPSWNDTATKKAILAYVDRVTKQGSMGGSGARFALIVHHTDAERERAYDRKSPFGRLGKALDEAQTKGWTVVDMKNDWKTIFPFWNE